MPAVRIIGPGRAGRALAAALEPAGWSVTGFLRRDDPVHDAAVGVDLLVVATPDAAVAEVAASVAPRSDVVVAHLSGALGLDALAPHPRRASLHPLRAIPDARTSLRGAWFAVAGDPLAAEVVSALGGHPLVVDDGDRRTYHAAAAIASNHLVALLGQVERVAALAGVPLHAYLDLVRGTVDNVERTGVLGALTGPVARGDWATVAGHLDALPPEERPTYLAMVQATARLAGRAVPDAVAGAGPEPAPSRPGQAGGRP